MCKLKFWVIGSISLVVGLNVTVGHAQEAVGAPVTGAYKADAMGLRNDAESLKQRIALVTEQLMQIKKCHDLGKMYVIVDGTRTPKCSDFFSVTP